MRRSHRNRSRWDEPIAPFPEPSPTRGKRSRDRGVLRVLLKSAKELAIANRIAFP
ncbi:MAG: hypothetical protein ACP5D7_19620 [Limnospira sp.]